MKTVILKIRWSYKSKVSLGSQLSNLRWMPNSTARILALSWEQACQVDSNNNPKPLRTEFGIHLRLESCEPHFKDFLFTKYFHLIKGINSWWRSEAVTEECPEPDCPGVVFDMMGNPCRMCVCVCILLLVCTVNYPFHKQKGDEFENKPHFSVSAGI